MKNVLLVMPYGRNERGRVLSPGGVMGEKLVANRVAIPISDSAIKAHATREFGGIPRVPEIEVDRMLRAYEAKAAR